MTKLRIHLFGPFEVFRNEQPLTNQDWRSQQTRKICKILLAHQGQVISSDRIIEILWPDDPLETARRRLHVRISQLRSALGNGKSIVRTVDGGYIFTLDEYCWLDVVAFETAIVEGSRFQRDGQSSDAIKAYERARDLYRGDFLSEDLYADWTITDREFYRERFITLLMELSEAYAQQGRYRLAVERCQQALARDPVRETLYVRLMLYHYYAGERSQSLRIYQRCSKMLADELAVTPLKSTIKIAESIQEGTLWADDDGPRYPPPLYEGRLFEVPLALSETPFVGRDKEYAWLIEHWKHPDTQLILLEGIAGIGKTRLANAFVGYIVQSEAQVLQARIPSGGRSPYAPLVTALQPFLKPKNLAKLSTEKLSALSMIFPQIRDRVSDLPELIELPVEAERQRLYDALVDFVAAGVEQPTLLFIDDAHRMGQVCSEALVRLTDSLKILLSYRSDEISSAHPIQNIFQNHRPPPAIFQLEPLASKDISKLIQRLAHNSLANVGEKIVKRTGGHPLYLVTLLQHMFDEGQLYVDQGGRWVVSGTEVPFLPPSIRETIEARLQRLDRSQRRIFDLAAVIGGEFNFDLLQAASQQEEEVLLATLDRLMDLALIVEPRRLGQSEFAITHDRYVEVAYETLPGVRRKHLHLQVAQAIEQVYADGLSFYYPALADHFGKAQVSERERDYAMLAGEQAAAQFANASALHYLERALQLTTQDEVELRLRLLLVREKVYDLLGDRQSQKVDLGALISLIDQLDPCQQAEIHLRQAAYDWILGDDTSAFDHLDASIQLAQTCGTTRIEAASLLLRGRGEIDQTKARTDLERALILAKQDGLRAMEGDIIRCLGNACFWQNQYEQSQSYFEEALAIHREVDDLRGELSALNNLGYLGQLVGDPRSAIDYFERALKICRKIGDRLAEGVLLGNLGNLQAMLGRYEQAQGSLEKAVAIREEIHNDEGVGSVLPVLGDTLRRQGKYKQASMSLERALAINTRIQHPEQQCASLDMLSQLHRDLGDYPGAQAYFERALSITTDDKAPNRVRALANGCLLYHLIEDNEKALELGEKALILSADLPDTRATALTNLGHVLTALQTYDEAAEKYQQALNLRRELLQLHLEIEPQAGLAYLALEMKADHQAFTESERIWPHLEAGSILGPDQPIWIYLTCYRVLLTQRDSRATVMLKSAFDLLQEREAAIDEDWLRESYLENVIIHQEMIQLFQKKQ